MHRTPLLLALCLIAGLAVAPTAVAADPPIGIEPDPGLNCVQVYPWSELCEGDVVDVLKWYLEHVEGLSDPTIVDV